MLEYGSLIWSSHQLRLIKKIESLPTRFLKMLAYKTSRLGVNLSIIASDNNLNSRSDRRKAADIVWVHKLVYNMIDCPE